MTARQVAQQYGFYKYTPSEGQTITDIVRFLYQSDNQRYYNILRELNNHVNWYALDSSTTIKWLSPQIISQVDATYS